MKISVACDHGGLKLKNPLIKHLESKGCEIIDCGCYSDTSCDYPDYALAAAEAVSNGEADYAMLICTTGIGMAMAANKVKGVRCALLHEVESARLTRAHNNANALAMGAMIVGEEDMKKIVDVFLSTPFEGGRHLRRVDKITAIENKYFK